MTENRYLKKADEWFHARADRIAIFLLITIVLILLIWPYATRIIPSGHVGVFYRIFGGTVLERHYGEGLHFFLPWNRMVVYDTRLQREDFEVSALSLGGLRIQVELTAVYRVKKEEAQWLHFRVGPAYAEKLIVPGTEAAVRRVAGNLHQSDLYNTSPIKIQEKVFKLLKQEIWEEETAIVLTEVFVRKIILPEKTAAAIEAKHEAEQVVYQERYKILQAYERYKKVFLEASTVRMAQNLINQGMTEAYLRYKGIEATRDLAASANAKLVIVGDKDGLPLILNPDNLQTKTPGAPGAAGGSEPGAPAGPGDIPPFEIPALTELEENIKKLDALLKEANGDKADSILTALPNQLLDDNNFFESSTQASDETDATPLQETKP